MTEQAEPTIVYHYTTMDAMMKIVESAQIWATSILYLNDVSEQDHLIGNVRDRIEAYKAAHPEVIPTIFNDLFASRTKNLLLLPFVASFSKNGDSLPQWRSYCPNGNGVAIGFSVDCLRRADLEVAPFLGAPGVSFEAVSYREAEDIAHLDGLIANAIERAMSWHLEMEGAIDTNSLFRMSIEDVACFYKHPSFSNEEEYRLTVAGAWQDPKLLDFRTTRSCLVPYLSVKIPQRQPGCPEANERVEVLTARMLGGSNCDFIEEIIVGPTSNMNLSVQAVGAFIDKLNLQVAVVPSSIPYRDW
jgi:hypothetical protein